MNTLSNTFLRLGVVFGLVGVLLGYGMGASEDHTLATAHAHTNLLGWVSMFLYGLFYRAFPDAAQGLLPKLHVLSALIGFLVMVSALSAKLLAIASLAAAANLGLIVGSTLVVLGMVIWAVIVFRGTRERIAP